MKFLLYFFPLRYGLLSFLFRFDEWVGVSPGEEVPINFPPVLIFASGQEKGFFFINGLLKIRIKISIQDA